MNRLVMDYECLQTSNQWEQTFQMEIGDKGNFII